MITAINKGFQNSIFQHNLVWKNKLSNQEVVFQANTIDNYKSLAQKLHEAEGLNLKPFCYSRILKGRISRYFTGKTETSPFENWVLKNDDQIFDRSYKKEMELSLLKKNQLLMPEIQPYQQIILNGLINQSNLKLQAPSYPSWTLVSNKFGIYKRCSPQVSNFLYQWYIWFSEKSDLKLKDLSTLFKDNQNKNLSMPPLFKNDRLDFNQKKEQILNYLEKRANSIPIKWTDLCNNLALTGYTPQARQPLKNWYQEYYTTQMVKLYGWFANSNHNSSNTSKTSDSFKFFKIDLKSEKTSLIDVLITVFLDAKKTVKTINEPLIASYYKSFPAEPFFKSFRPQFLSSYFLNDNTNQRFETLKQFNNLNNKAAFIDYLKNTPGLYSQLALWTINNPFPLTNSNLKVEHHIIPQFLGKKFSNLFDQTKINRPYNISLITVMIHLLMHIVRLLEYGDFQDLKALTIISQQPGWRDVSPEKFYDPQTILANTFTNLFKSKLLQNYPQTEKELVEFSAKRTRSNAYKRLNKKVKSVLTVNTLWYHKNDGSDQPFQFTFYAQSAEECSIEPLAEKILTVSDERNKVSEKTFEPKDSKAARRRLSDYLRNVKHTNSVYGFYIVSMKARSSF